MPGETWLRAELSKNEADDFVMRGARALVEAGYSVSGVPEESRVAVSAEVGDEAGRPADAPPVRLKVRVDGEEVTADEIRFLLEQKSSFVFFRDRWIEVDRGILREALRALVNPVKKFHHTHAEAPDLKDMPDTSGDEIPAEALKFATFLKFDEPKAKSHPSRGNIH